jgi:putative SOS response-associated peptidase YedK
MCGRYALFGEADALTAQSGLGNAFHREARYNIAPGQFSPVIQQSPDGARVAVCALGPAAVLGQGAADDRTSVQCEGGNGGDQADVPPRDASQARARAG